MGAKLFARGCRPLEPAARGERNGLANQLVASEWRRCLAARPAKLSRRAGGGLSRARGEGGRSAHEQANSMSKKLAEPGKVSRRPLEHGQLL